MSLLRGHRPWRRGAALVAATGLLFTISGPTDAALRPRVTAASLTEFNAPISAYQSLSCVASSCMAIASGNGATWLTHSANAGVSWGAPHDPSGAFLQSVACASATVCVASAQDHEYTTTNGGSTWTGRPQPAAVPYFETISCLKNGDCAAVGPDRSSSFFSRTYFSTTNGSTWTARATVPLLAAFSLSCGSASSCVVVGQSPGDQGQIFSTVNAGLTWTLRATNLNPTQYRSVSCPVATHCVAVGGSDTSSGVSSAAITTSSADGLWHVISPPAHAGNLASVSCSTATACRAVGLTRDRTAGIVLTQTTGTWALAPLPSGENTPQYLVCTATKACVAVGTGVNSQGVVGTSALFKSWTLRPLALTPSYLSAASCVSANVCVVVGMALGQPMSESTSDGGLTWVPAAIPMVTGEMNAVSCPSATTCFAVGSSAVVTNLTPTGSGMIFVSTNAGHTWAVRFVLSGNTRLNGISCPTLTRCLAVGTKVTPNGNSSVKSPIALTSSDGTVWSPLSNLPSGSGLAAISCGSSLHCVITGGDPGLTAGAFSQTTDGGSSWSNSDVALPTGSVSLPVCLSATVCHVAGLTDPSHFQMSLMTSSSGAAFVPTQNFAGTATSIDAFACNASGACQVDSTRVSTGVHSYADIFSAGQSSTSSVTFAPNQLAPFGPGSAVAAKWIGVGEDPATNLAAIEVN